MLSPDDPRLDAIFSQLPNPILKEDLYLDHRRTTNITGIISTIIAFLFILLRLWARFRTTFGYGIDDLLIIISLVFMLGNLACNFAFTHYGVGTHSVLLEKGEISHIGKIVIANTITYTTNINLIKLSVLTMYYRFFPVRPIRLGGIMIATISCLWNLSLITFAFVQCRPFKKLWEPWTEGTCVDERASYLSLFVPSIITDIAILSLPLPYIWRLQTNFLQKLYLTLIFLLGSFVLFASIFRYIVYVRLLLRVDPIYGLADGLSWNMIEISSGIVSACLPTLGPIMRKFLKKLKVSAKCFASTHMTSNLSQKRSDEVQLKNNLTSNEPNNSNTNEKSYCLGDPGKDFTLMKDLESRRDNSEDL